jgi:peptidoglycan/LPS O-acetylase OafA/YrhL
MGSQHAGSTGNLIGYRKDVDGLRAVAVLSVVAYHISHALLPGGYLGVDMFFVISGFLITSIIWRETLAGDFSIVRFYDRRIRRIMPALVLMSAVVTGAAIVLLLPADLMGYSKSLLATVGFVANVYFWRDTNYFSRAAEEKPLLHLWSLGVEEQFYILLPLILLLLGRFWRRGVLFTIALLAIGSFVLNVAALLVGAESPAFFLLPTRVWELGLGAVLAVLPTRFSPRGMLAEGFAVAGGLLVLAGLAHPSPVIPFSPVALPVVVGVTFLILAGRQDTPLANRLLALRPIVLVGLISYSLYLWHWPIIVLGKYYLARDFTHQEVALALLCMMVCATASWRFVERPFRSGAMPMRTVRHAAFAGISVLVLAAAVLFATRGLPSRLSKDASLINSAVGTNYRCPVSDYIVFGRARACSMNLPSRDPSDADVVLLGNSHAQMYAPVWESILVDRGKTGLLVPVNACLPTVRANISQSCIDAARANLDAIVRLQRVETVILGLTWEHAVDGLVNASGSQESNDDSRSLIAAIDDLIDQLRGAGKEVVLIGPIAQPGWDVASVVSRQLAFGHPFDRPHNVPVAEFEARFGVALRHFESREDISFVRPDRVQCPAEKCEYFMDGRSLFADSNHVAMQALGNFRPLFDAAMPLHRNRTR